MFKLLCNISDIPDYRSWSQLIDPARHLIDVQETLRNQKIKSRQTVADFLIRTKNLRPADGLGDPLDIERWKVTDVTVVRKIADILGFSRPSGRVQVLPPGAMIPLHFDDLRFGYINNAEPSYEPTTFTTEELRAFEQNPDLGQRVLVMLEDSHPGQALLFKDQVCNHWRRGDVIHWDWRTVEHATINVGYWSRPLLLLSGLVKPSWFAQQHQSASLQKSVSAD